MDLLHSLPLELQFFIDMTLSNSTIQNLATALTPEVIEYIQNDERWVHFLHEIVPDAVTENLGAVDENVLYELSLCIMDSIVLK